MVYYLKYRPQSLEDLVGQEKIKETLTKQLEKGSLSHAYLFTGPKGVGKTSTARILAKMVNCEKGGCNKCEICTSITDGSNMDLIEIDGASNRGIDDIRELRDKVKLSPTSLKKKIYIIDEVHMLTTEAFNALLKTLEEPPSHALFILATTEVQKVPQTIQSRVTRLDFTRATVPDLVKALKKVAVGEKIEVEDEALKLLAQRGDGSYRDGIKLLDQLGSLGEKITSKMVEDSLRVGRFESLVALLESFVQKDPKAGLELIKKELEDGTNLKEYQLSIMETLRNLLLIKHQVQIEESEEKLVALKDLAGKFSVADLIQYISNFQRAYEDMKTSSIQQLPIEVAIIESSAQSTPVQVERSREEVTVSVGVAVKASEDTTGVQNLPEVSTAPAGALQAEVSSEAAQPKAEKSQEQTGDMQTLLDKWNYILEMVRPYNFSLEALLKQVKIFSVEDNTVFLSVPYSFHQRILETPRNRELLESVLTDVLGKNVKVGCVLEARPVRVEELANVEVAADDDVIKIAAEIFNS
jgi:DNA polymerase III subunit gamma/tau